jgi:hypothetical protein
MFFMTEKIFFLSLSYYICKFFHNFYKYILTEGFKMENYKVLRNRNRVEILSNRTNKDNARIIAKIKRQLKKVEK